MVHILRLFCVAPKKYTEKEWKKHTNIRNTSQKVIDILYDIRRMRNPRPISFAIFSLLLIQCELLVCSCLCVCSCIQFSARFQFTKIDNTIKKENRLNLSQTRCVCMATQIYSSEIFDAKSWFFDINKEKEKLIFCCRCLRFQRAKISRLLLLFLLHSVAISKSNGTHSIRRRTWKKSVYMHTFHVWCSASSVFWKTRTKEADKHITK